MMLQKFGQRLFRNRTQNHVFNGNRQRAVFFQRDQNFRQPRLVCMLDEVIAHFGWLHIRGRGQNAFEIAKFLNQLGRGLWANARYARHIIYAIAHEREHIANLFRANTKFFMHFFGADAFVFHGVEHVDARFHKLHQVLIAADDGDMPASGTCSLGVACDHVIGFDIILFDQRQRKRARCIADHWKLRL